MLVKRRILLTHVDISRIANFVVCDVDASKLRGQVAKHEGILKPSKLRYECAKLLYDIVKKRYR